MSGRPESFLWQHHKVCLHKRDKDDDEQRHKRSPREESEQNQQLADNFKRADERPEKFRRRNSNLANLPLPSSLANRNFCIPSDKNTAPTSKPIMMIAFGACVRNSFSNLD